MDVQHLREIGEIEDYPIFIDSSLRDKVAYPTPSEYEIVFDIPFTNVVSLDLLDSSIPNSQGVVDIHNNLFSMSYRTRGTDGTIGKTIIEHLEILGESKTFREIFNDAVTPRRSFKYVGQYADFENADEVEGSIYTTIYDRSVALTEISPSDAILGTSGTILPLGRFGSKKEVKNQFYISRNGSTYKWRYATGSTEYILPTFEDGVTKALVSLVNGEGRTLYYFCDAVDLLETPLHDVTRVIFGTGSAVLEGHCHYEVSETYYNSISTFVHEVISENIFLEIGDHDVNTLYLSLTNNRRRGVPIYAYEGLDETAVLDIFSVEDDIDFTKDRRYKFTSRDFFFFDMRKSTANEVLGFSEFAKTSQSEYEKMNFADNKFLFGAKNNGPSDFVMITPGVINTFGERFITLRCPQLEGAYSNSSLAYTRMTAGVAVFKLVSQYLSNLRFDFANSNRQISHPIGKLSKLLFRWEKPDGSLYNFKGVDHHLFVTVKCLRPKSKIQLVEPERRLNPDYDPDVLKFITNYHAEDLDGSSTEDEEEILNSPGYQRRYRMNLQRYRSR